MKKTLINYIGLLGIVSLLSFEKGKRDAVSRLADKLTWIGKGS